MMAALDRHRQKVSETIVIVVAIVLVVVTFGEYRMRDYVSDEQEQIIEHFDKIQDRLQSIESAVHEHNDS
jgi:hypothetical protein